MDLKEKKKKINSLKNEVKEFHPLLQKLLVKLPKVSNIEYTHGNNEKGADFILTSSHEVLNHQKYIGLIVKIGEINKNLRAIEEQIDDCKLERYILNGKKKIHIDEVWIVTNDKITDPAREKIYEKFSKAAIFFIEDVDIIKFIDEHLPNYWYEIPITLGDYIRTLSLKNDETDKNSCLVNIDDKSFYIEQEIKRREKDYDKKRRERIKKRESINIFKEILASKITFIEGSMGSGKSKLLRRVIDFFSSPKSFIEHKLIPVNISFREITEIYNLDIEKFIKEKTSSISKQEISTEIQFLVLIDAVDEKKADVDEQLDLLSKLIEQINKFPNIKAVITSRYLHIVDGQNSILNHINHLELLPLSQKKVILFINKICSKLDISKRLFEDLKKSFLFKELQRSPIGVILLAKLMNENNVDLPQNMTELYSKYTELVLGRWDIDKGLQSQKEYEVAEMYLMILSEYIIDNGILWINKQDALLHLENYLNARNLGIDANSLFNKVLKRSEIIEEDLSGRTIKFKHKAFAEYFYAKKQLRNPKFTIDTRVFQIYWGEIYFFYIGLLRDCPELLEAITNLKTTEEVEKWMKIINLGNLFLAGYQSPYHIFQENLQKVIIEATQLYLDIVSRKNDSFFSNFTEMNLLCLMQGIIRDCYSFKFFEKALIDSCLHIDTNTEINTVTKIYSLFFISVIGMDLESSAPFDYLLKNYKSQLPQPIELAIKFETENIKQQSSLLKKINKRTLKNLRTNQSYNMLAKNLSERPINLKKIQ